jgi:hypothetical protein
MSEAAATGAAVAVALAAFKVIEALIAKISNGKGGNGRNGMVKRIHEVVTRTDGDGAPMIYGAAGHREILAELQKMTGHLESINNGVRNGGQGGGGQG